MEGLMMDVPLGVRHIVASVELESRDVAGRSAPSGADVDKLLLNLFECKESRHALIVCWRLRFVTRSPAVPRSEVFHIHQLGIVFV